MRPIDLAREHGLSAQAIRNYDDAGIFPPTARTESGYRRYTPLHAQALRAFLALRAGHGHQRATAILRAVHRGDLDAAYRLIDAAHVALLDERGTRADVASALRELSTTMPARIAGPAMTIGELARRLALHPATLRTWEARDIVRPDRDRATGYRRYGPECVRDAEIARQLRRGGYPLSRIAQFLDALRAAGGAEPLRQFLEDWQDRLTTRGRTLLHGAAELDIYLTREEAARAEAVLHSRE
ncbi:MerR family transcriptional regulator [Nocardia rhizosphaerae]|uniref:MerR family transcriptional regulator n=1 Tax=Nocardia rhizosphaerae TaxID=1691571 RepID=A0ABV8L889_9NOCA